MSGLNILRHLHTLRKIQWLDTRRILEIQEKKLRAILKHAYRNVEFYHRRLDELKLKPDDIKTVKDLQKIPVLTRPDIQANFPDRMISKGVSLDRCAKHVSSGSTGIPVMILGDRRTEDYRAALFGRPFFECGLRWRDKMLRISMIREKTRTQKWYERLGFMRRITVSPLDPIESGLNTLSSYRPDAIFGHTSYIYLLAEELARTHKEGKKPRLIFTTGEITTRKARKFINSVFETEAFDLYGCVEVERVAWECKEHSGYHIDIDSQVVEFVDGDEQVAPNEQGRILITCLYNYAMPLIRYNVGDMGTPLDDECPCGRGLPLMKNIEGRENDFVKLPSGRIISPAAFIYIDEIPGVANFRVLQEKLDKMKVEVVLDKKYPSETIGKHSETIERVEDYLRYVVGEGMRIEVISVEEISAEKSGKTRIVKSLVEKNH